MNVVRICLENSVNIVNTEKVPYCFDSFHTLNVWTPYGQLMKSVYATFNNDRPYANPRVYCTSEQPMLSKEDVLSRFARQEELIVLFNLYNRHHANFSFKGNILGLHKVTETAFVLTLGGNAHRHAHEGILSTPVTMVCFYETGNFGCTVYGFAVIPELVCYQLGCGRA